MACLQVSVSVGMKMVKAKVQGDGLLQSVYSRSFQSSAVHGRCREIPRWKQHCVLTCYNYREDTLELEEDDLILLLDVLHQTNEVVTVAEAAESVEMNETAVDEVQHEGIPRRRKKRFESDFFLL